MGWSRRARLGGFTLIELLAVMTIMVVLLSAVAVRWFGPWQALAIRSDIERIIDHMNHARSVAMRDGASCIIEFDEEIDGFAVRVDGDSQSATRRFAPRSASSVEAFWVPSVTGPKPIESIEIDQSGASPTFAVEFRSGDTRRFLLFAGRTGQCTVFDGERDVIRLLQGLSAGGIDLD